MEIKNVFDYINSINAHDYSPPDEGDKIYNQFIINKGFSYYSDTVLLVNEVNKQGFSNRQHYDFLFGVIDKRNRRSKWFKEDRDEGIDLIVEYYEVSVNKAREWLRFFSPEDLKTIKDKLEKGGV